MHDYGEVAAGIVTYNPEIAKLDRNIMALMPQAGHIYIFDNGSDNLNEIRNRMDYYLNELGMSVSIVENYVNAGMACALNRLFERAEEAGFTWLITLDQDSELLEGCVARYLIKGANFASLTCMRRDRNDPDAKMADGSVEEVERCITSGNMVRIDVWRAVGGFNEKLFIDMVDFDFCYRLRQKGYKIGRLNETGFIHEMGEKNGYIHILGKTHFTGNYNSFRKYYIFRNMHFVIRKYGLKNHYYSYKRLLLLFAATILFEDDKIARIRNEIKGFWDGFKDFEYLEDFSL